MLKIYRLALGDVSQRELARRTKLSRETIARAERSQGTPTLDTARRISDGLGVSIGVLFGGLESDRKQAAEALRETAKR